MIHSTERESKTVQVHFFLSLTFNQLQSDKKKKKKKKKTFTDNQTPYGIAGTRWHRFSSPHGCRERMSQYCAQLHLKKEN